MNAYIRNKTYVIFTFIFLGFLLMLPSSYAKASSAGVSEWLKAGKTYKSYDLDGDGKKDKIKIKSTEGKNGYAKAVLYVNGKKVYTVKNISPYSDDYTDCARIRIITLKNSSRYIYLSVDNESVSRDFLLQYKAGKITLISDFSSIMSKYSSVSYGSWYPNVGVSVSGNTVYFDIVSMNWTLGSAVFQFKYKYSNNTLKMVNSYGKVSGGFGNYIAAQEFVTYKNVGSKSTAFVVKNNESVKIPSFRIKNGKMWLCVENSSGETGWIKSLTTQGTSRSLLFSNAWYAS